MPCAQRSRCDADVHVAVRQRINARTMGLLNNSIRSTTPLSNGRARPGLCSAQQRQVLGSRREREAVTVTD